jgi:menaquinone-dependent protoporphyrinogen IX oxidase
MRILVLYRSWYGNTRNIADAIAGRLHALGHQAIVQDVRRHIPDLAGVDRVLIGAPTRFARVSVKAASALRTLRRRGLGGRPIATFDTYGPLPKTPEEAEENRKWLEPGAAVILRREAERLGLKVFAESLRCAVKEYKGPLADGELEKAALFAERFAAAK